MHSVLQKEIAFMYRFSCPFFNILLLFCTVFDALEALLHDFSDFYARHCGAWKMPFMLCLSLFRKSLFTAMHRNIYNSSALKPVFPTPQAISFPACSRNFDVS